MKEAMKDKITELISTATDDSRLGFFDYTRTVEVNDKWTKEMHMDMDTYMPNS